MSQAKCLTLEALLDEIREKAAIKAREIKKLPQRCAAQFFYLMVHELFSLEVKDRALAMKLQDLFYWADELRYNTALVDDEPKLMAALTEQMQPFLPHLWQFREAWRYIEFRNDFGKDLWYYEVVNYLKLKGLYGAPYYMRVSRDSPDLWVYTENEEHGRADRQIKVKLGKILTKLLPNEKPADIQRVATYFQNAGAMGVQFARTEAECIKVYADGPQSCMKGSQSPKAYASPDLAVAYVTDINGRITARTVCNMIQRTYTRIYGNIDGIEPALQKEGWKRGNLNGCRLKTIFVPGTNCVVIPWVDHPDAGLTVPISGLDGRAERAAGGMITGSTRCKWLPDTETLVIDHVDGTIGLGTGGQYEVKRTEKGKAYTAANPVMQPIAPVADRANAAKTAVAA